MLPLLQHTRLITGLLVVMLFTRVVVSSTSATLPIQKQTSPQSSELDSDVSHWSSQLKSGDLEERREAVHGLSHIRTTAATSALIFALDDSSPIVRASAVGALGDRVDAGSAAAIALRLSSDKDPFVRKTAAYALGKATGAERTSALIAALKDKEPEVRAAAAVSLGEKPDAAAVEPLASALSDKSDFVRAQAARALGVNGRAAARAVASLVKLLTSDPDGEVKRQAAVALGSIGDRSALSALERAARDSDPYLAQAARASIRLIEEPVK